VGATAAAARKRAAAPSWQTIAGTFDKLGGVAERNAKGEIVGYKYPRPKTDEQRRQINAMVYEMWHPHRRVSTDMGMERSARAEMTTLVDRRTGARRQVRVVSAEKLARKAGLVEVSRYRGRRIERGRYGGMLWAWSHGWNPLGVRCLGEPLDGGLREVATDNYQIDPDGRAWEWNADDRAWLPVEGE
jgi:hypothetical protein